MMHELVMRLSQYCTHNIGCIIFSTKFVKLFCIHIFVSSLWVAASSAMGLWYCALF